MEIVAFYIYAAIVKLALVGAGALAVMFGYRLFLFGIGADTAGQVTADASKLTLSLSNAAPGTCFALFGAAIIASVAWNAAPAYQTEAKGPGGATSRTLVRGGAGANDASIQSYATRLSDGSLTLREAAPLLAGLAEMMVNAGRNAEAKAYAQLALQVDDSSVKAAAAQAVALARLGDCTDARELIDYIESVAGEAASSTVREIDDACP